MRKETIQVMVELRKEHGFTTGYVAEFLGISENEYQMFEECKGAPEDDYFIISGLSYLYGKSMDNIFKAARGNVFLSDTLGDYAGFTSGMQDYFKEILSGLEVVDNAAFLTLKEQKNAVKFSYVAENGRIEYIVLTEYDKSAGYYFLILNGKVQIAKFIVYDGEICFEANGRMYPEKLNTLKVIAKIYAKLDLGDE